MATSSSYIISIASAITTYAELNLFDWLYRFLLMQMVFNSLGVDTHTHTRTNFPDKAILRNQARAYIDY